MPQVFPDSVTSVQKCIRNRLWLMRSPPHPRQIPFLCRKRPGFHPEMMLLTRREKKKGSGEGELSLGIFKLPV